MPPKKKKSKDTKGKGKGDAEEKTPEMILADLSRDYKKVCTERKIDPLDCVLKQIKHHLELDDGAQVVTKFVFADPIPVAGLSAFLEAMDTYEPVRAFHFWRSPIGDEGAHVLCEFLKRDKKVRIVELSDARLGPRGCYFLSSFLGSGSAVNKALLRLELDFNDIGDEGAEVLCQALMANETALEHLSFKFCGLGPKSGVVLGSALLPCHRPLRFLDLQGNPLGAEGVEALSNGLSKAENLKGLNLRQTGFAHSRSAVEALCRGIDGCPSLNNLDLNQNLFAADDARLLLETLKKRPKGGWESVVFHESIDPDVFKEVVVLAGGEKKGAKAKKKGKKKG